jgi:hypothetical protein
VGDLVRWLGAQLDEDERIAGAATPGPWVDQGGYVTDSGPDGLPRVQVTDHGTQDGEPEEDNPQGRADSAHIAEHDPARVLREITARRRTIGQHAAAVERMDRAMRDNDTAAYQRAMTMEIAFRAVLRNDAAVYLDRPGYRMEWRP